MQTKNYAYITLLSTLDYLPGVLVLGESLKRVNSVYPFAVGVTEDIYEQALPVLQKAGCIVEKIHHLEYSDMMKKHALKQWGESCKSVFNTASKISLFELNDYDKLVYIDADTIVLQNVDELFNWPDGSMAKHPVDDYGFTGLMVFTPAHHKVELYKILIRETNCADGDLLGELWFQTKYNPAYHIPSEYMEQYHCGLINESHVNDYKIIHFCNNPKPWQKEFNILSADWYTYYYSTLLNYVQNKYGVYC